MRYPVDADPSMSIKIRTVSMVPGEGPPPMRADPATSTKNAMGPRLGTTPKRTMSTLGFSTPPDAMASVATPAQSLNCPSIWIGDWGPLYGATKNKGMRRSRTTTSGITYSFHPAVRIIPRRLADRKPVARPAASPFVRPRPFVIPFVRPNPFVRPFVRPSPLVRPFVWPRPFVNPFVRPTPFVSPFVRPRPFVRPFVRPRSPFVRPFRPFVLPAWRRALRDRTRPFVRPFFGIGLGDGFEGGASSGFGFAASGTGGDLPSVRPS